VGDYVTLAGQVGVSGHLEIGDYTIAGGQAGITKSIPPKQILMGTPAIPDRDWKKRTAYTLYVKALKERVRKIEQLLQEEGKELPPRNGA
jgi:UDP-3-O-[3-hydroxymyristoyl] glucosamine N-acyltransferase